MIPLSREPKGAIERLRSSPPSKSAILDIDEMGPVTAKTYPGKQAIARDARPATRATYELGRHRGGKAGRGRARERAGRAATPRAVKRTSSISSALSMASSLPFALRSLSKKDRNFVNEPEALPSQQSNSGEEQAG